MLLNVITSIITDEYQKKFKDVARQAYIDGAPDLTTAMKMEFSLYPDFKVEDGYRNLEIILFGFGMNYIGVFARVNWNVLPNDKEDYVQGETPWVCYGYHDSCWRDGLRALLKEFEPRLATIRSLMGWYQRETLSQETIKELREANDKREFHTLKGLEFNPKE